MKEDFNRMPAMHRMVMNRMLAMHRMAMNRMPVCTIGDYRLHASADDVWLRDCVVSA